MPKVRCQKCSKYIDQTIAGSLTQFLSGRSSCDCEAPQTSFAKAKLDISYCSRCAKKLKSSSDASLTAFLQNRVFCCCKRKHDTLNTVRIARGTTTGRNKKNEETKFKASSSVALSQDRKSRAAEAVMQAQLLQELEISKVLAGTYKLIDMLGEGGMSYVYLAEHTRLHRMVALKVMKADIDLPNKVELFSAEARRLVMLSHPSLTQVLDFAMHKGQWPLIAMELLEGETLADRLSRLGPMTISEAIFVFRQVAEGLAYVHLKGLVHKDLKPGNIMLVRRDETVVKILDFGISQLRSNNLKGAAELPLSPNSECSSGSTADLFVVGSPSYMSPEEWQAGEVSPRTDLYAFGCSLFEALTGDVPYVAETIEELKQQHLTAPYPGLTGNSTNSLISSYPPALDRLLLKLLAKEPKDRFYSAQEVLNAIDLIEMERTSGSSTIGVSDINVNRKSSAKHWISLFLVVVLFLVTTSSALMVWLKMTDVDGRKVAQNSLAAKNKALEEDKALYRNYLSIPEITGVGLDAKAKGKPKSQALERTESLGTEPKIPKKPYITTADGIHYICSFPQDQSLGTLTNVDSLGVSSGVKIEMQGAQRFTADKKSGSYREWSYSPSPYALRHPQVIAGLANYPIEAITVKPPPIVSSALNLGDTIRISPDKPTCYEDMVIAPDFWRYLKSLKLLKSLSLIDVPLDSGTIAAVGELESLKALVLRSPHGRAAEINAQESLANNKNLLHLKYLSVGASDSSGILLERLSHSEQLVSLQFRDCKLSKSDCIKLGQFGHLRELSLIKCLYLESDACEILKAPNLVELRLPQQTVHDAFLERALKCKRLRLLVVSIDSASRKDSRSWQEIFAERHIELTPFDG